MSCCCTRILHLCSHHTPQVLPRYTFHSDHHWHCLRASHITLLLKASAAAVGTPYGCDPQDVDARSLWASVAMALLCARVDTDIVQLVGRWRSDARPCYVFVQAIPSMQQFAPLLLQGGHFTLPLSPPLDPMHHTP
jgi:hypothetical protein